MNLFVNPEDYISLKDRYVAFAVTARRQGLLALEKAMEEYSYESHSFMKHGLGLAIDGTDPGMVHSILQWRIQGELEMTERYWKIWKYFILSKDHGEELKASLLRFCFLEERRDEIVRTLIEIDELLSGNRGEKKIGNYFELPLTAACLEMKRELPEDAGEVLEFYFMSYLARLRNAYQMHLRGILSVQSGDNPRIVTAIMESTANLPASDPGIPSFAVPPERSHPMTEELEALFAEEGSQMEMADGGNGE